MRTRPIVGTILLSHTHWDHIHGLPFFAPAFVSGNQFSVYGSARASKSLASTLAGQMESPYSPLPMSELPGTLQVHELTEKEFTLNGVRVRAQRLNHPGMTLASGSRQGPLSGLRDGQRALPIGRGRRPTARAPVRDGDHDAALARFASEADLLISDAQYTWEEYRQRVGWGHTCYRDTPRLGIAAGVKRLALFHHDPERTDEQLDRIVAECREELARQGVAMECFASQEGLTLTL